MSTLALVAADPARIEDVPRDDLPALAGEAAALHARIVARIMTHEATPAPPAATEGPDRLLTVAEAAERLGVAPRWMYRHADTLPFTRRLAPGTLRFSERGLARWQATRRAA